MQSHVLVFLLVVAAASTATVSKISPRRSKETHLEVQNLFSEDVTNILVSLNSASDWEDGRGPKDFEGLIIPAGDKISKREEVDYHASSNYFTMTLEFADGSSDVFKANLRGAIGEGDVDLNLISVDHKITSSTGGKTLTILVKKK